MYSSIRRPDTFPIPLAMMQPPGLRVKTRGYKQNYVPKTPYCHCSAKRVKHSSEFSLNNYMYFESRQLKPHRRHQLEYLEKYVSSYAQLPSDQIGNRRRGELMYNLSELAGFKADAKDKGRIVDDCESACDAWLSLLQMHRKASMDP